VYLTNGAVLSGFTLTGGATLSSGAIEIDESGGGVWCEGTNAIVTNCTVTANTSYNFAGGAYSGTFVSSTLDRCTLTENSGVYGGEAEMCALRRCILERNSAINGGGADSSELEDCLLQGNSGSTPGIAGGGPKRVDDPSRTTGLMPCQVIGARAFPDIGTRNSQ
jgi:hypothetical protein